MTIYEYGCPVCHNRFKEADSILKHLRAILAYETLPVGLSGPMPHLMWLWEEGLLGKESDWAHVARSSEEEYGPAI